MLLYFGGAEVPTHRKWLSSAGVTHVYLSYVGLSRRVKFSRPWLIADKFPQDMNVMLDAGAYTFNKEDAADADPGRLAEIAQGYEYFAAANAERVDCLTEFDALPLGLDWIKSRREDFYDDLGDKFMPVWHAEWGLSELDAMVSRYRRIGILQTALGDRDLVPVLNLHAANRGTLFHGLAMTKPSIMREVRWASVGSTSWISPMQFGDTFVWTGRGIKRYPKAYKDQARKRYRTLFTASGFDAEKIAADDTQEVARLSLWSWQELLRDINKHRAPAPQEQPEQREDDDARPPAVPVLEHRQTELLPGLTRPARNVEIRSDSLRRCNTCFLAERGCPGYKPNATCLYSIPIEISGPADIKHVEEQLIAMQTQRVLFMRATEDLEGGYVDPNLSNEIDRLSRMIKAQRDGTMIRESVTMKSNRPGEAGMFSRMFGAEAAQAAQAKAISSADDLIKATPMGDAYEITGVPLRQEGNNG